MPLVVQAAWLAMLAEAMIPEAFHDAQPFTGFVTAVGFLAAFLMIKLTLAAG